MSKSIVRRIRSTAALLTRRSLSAAAAGTGLYGLARRCYGGLGVILMLHRVTAPGRPILWPGYAIDAAQLDAIIRGARRLGFEPVSLDEVHARLTRGEEGRRFVCFTLDDGYRDNLTVAAPVFRKHRVPYCVNATSGLVDRSGFYWWGALEDLVLATDRVEVPGNAGQPARFLPAGTLLEKRLAYDAMNDVCAEMSAGEVKTLLAAHRIDWDAALDRDFMTPPELRELAADPLATIGGHGTLHERLSSKEETEVRRELEDSRRILEDWTGVAVRHMAYPYGSPDSCGTREFELARQAGWATAVTTRRGNVFSEHGDHLTALPRRGVPLDAMSLRNALSGVESVLRGWPRFQAA